MSKVDDSFKANLRKMNEDELSNMVVEIYQKIREIKEEKAKDVNLAKAKLVVKDLSSGYNDVIKKEKSKIEAIIDRIKELQDGINPNSSDK